MDYWNLVEPIWESISIYDGPDDDPAELLREVLRESFTEAPGVRPARVKA